MMAPPPRHAANPFFRAGPLPPPAVQDGRPLPAVQDSRPLPAVAHNGLPPLTARAVVALVARQFGLTPADLLGPWRDFLRVRARFAAIFLVRETLPYSLPRIGREMGGRDHATIWHALRRCREMQDADPEYRATVQSLLCRARQLRRTGGESHHAS